ncbi:hypothetical protein J6590_056458 [Homalodisca vitripennis]|nr:hypothetical protein J6590_056458 [Homalodisca vitripennis]
MLRNTGRLCSAGLSCCSEQTEMLLKASLRHQHEQNIRQQLTTLSAVLKARATKFDGKSMLTCDLVVLVFVLFEMNRDLHV